MPSPSRPDSSPSHAGPTVRRQVEDYSRPVLTRLHRLPRLVVPLATLVLIALGILAPTAVGLAALVVVAAFICWISYLSWPVVPTSGRLIRLLMVILLGVLAASRF